MYRISGAALVLFTSTSVLAGAALASDPTPAPSAWISEGGVRYWYSTGRSNYDLFGISGTPAGDVLFSRLTWDDLTGHTGETFFRVDHLSGLFIKGYIGAGVIEGGNLDDKDFCNPFLGGPEGVGCFLAGAPTGARWSDTLSAQKGGSLKYLDIDLGYTFYNTMRSKEAASAPGAVRIGVFTGYHLWQEKIDAFGLRCNGDDLGPVFGGTFCGSPGTVVESFGTKVITNDTTWHSWRLGIAGDMQLSRQLKLSGEAAYVRTWLDAKDTHWLRLGTDFNGPTPQDGTGNGFQLEAVLSYQLSEVFGLGIGARWWHVETDGTMHFENSAIGGTGGPQNLKYDADRYGVFVQGSLKLN